ncbi:hypothetical protein METP3_03789 [Methanosarcinales archaeon]|nr:hypothetical protein METP3_03789 [Methanosarcinales archaeon]
MDEKFSDKVFAAADQAVGHGGEKVPILGHLIWYSVKESRIRTSDLRKLFAQVNIPMDFMPEEPSKINAFKRATTELSEETEVDIGEGKHAVYMVRLAAKTDDEIVKSIVKEVRDASKKALTSEDYAEIGRVHFDKDTEDVRYYDLQPDSQPITTQIKQLYETYCSYLTGKQIRVMFHEIIKSMSPTLVRPSGAVYFIPYVHAEMVQKMEVLSKELVAYGITDYESAFESIPLIDADKTRALVEVRFEEQNTRDVDRTLVELSKLLQGTDTTTKTAAKYVEMVKASKETISRYEGLLNKEMSIARMKVEVLDQQVRKLVEKVAQQPLISPKAEEKKETTEPSIAVIVPHPEQAQESATAKPVLPAPIEGLVAAPASPEAHNIVGGFTVVVPKAEQVPRAEQSLVTESDVNVDETRGVLVIPEPVLQAEANIETQAEADAQLDGNTHNLQRPVSVMNAPVEFTSESLLV